jgi:hypothetical protein
MLGWGIGVVVGGTAVIVGGMGVTVAVGWGVVGNAGNVGTFSEFPVTVIIVPVPPFDWGEGVAVKMPAVTCTTSASTSFVCWMGGDGNAVTGALVSRQATTNKNKMENRINLYNGMV